MSSRIPLVVASGQLQQLQAADIADTAITRGTVNVKTNANAGSIVIGAPVYVKSDGTVDKARANAAGTMPCSGLVYDASISAAGTGRIQVDGIVVATTAQWDVVVVSGSGGLIPGSFYYVDAATAGKITATATTTVAQYVQQVGVAMSTTEMRLTDSPAVLL